MPIPRGKGSNPGQHCPFACHAFFLFLPLCYCLSCCCSLRHLLPPMLYSDRFRLRVARMPPCGPVSVCVKVVGTAVLCQKPQRALWCLKDCRFWEWQREKPSEKRKLGVSASAQALVECSHVPKFATSVSIHFILTHYCCDWKTRSTLLHWFSISCFKPAHSNGISNRNFAPSIVLQRQIPGVLPLQ